MRGKTAHLLVARALLKEFSVTLVPKAWPRSNVSIERQLLSYLNEHPEAKDTLEGIMTWWLSATDPDEARSRLDELVARGLVCAECGPDGRIYYCRGGKGSKLQKQIAAEGDGKIENRTRHFDLFRSVQTRGTDNSSRRTTGCRSSAPRRNKN